MAGSVKGIIVEIGGNTSGLQKALSKVNSSTASLSKELRGVNSLLKLDPKNTEMLSQKQTLLSKNIEETSNKLEQLKEAQKVADDQIANRTKISDDNYRSLQREIVATENKLKELKAEASNWTNAGKEIEEFGNKVVAISDKIDKIGTTITTGVTLPIVGIATAAVKTGSDFEAQMSRVQAIAGATKEELGKLTDQAVELGAKTFFGASDVAEAMENLASAGFNTNEIMEAVPGLLDLAASSGAELGTSAEITASTIRGFGLEASKSAHIADVFAEAAARTNAQTEDMGEAMKYVAPVAKTVGLSVEETAAAIGIMSDAGVKGSQAGTTLRGGLTRIIKPTKQVKEAMDKLGVSFYDNNGKMKSLTDIVQSLQTHTQGLTDETKNQALAQIFGTEALSGMLALVNRGSSELSDMTKSFQNCDGAASKMAETMLDNTSGSIEEMKGSLESAGIAIQKTLAPEIRDLAKKVENLVNKFNDLSDEEKDQIIKIAKIIAVIGPAIKIVGKFGSTIGEGTKATGKFVQAIGLIGKTSTTSFAKADADVQGMATALTAIVSPAGLATIGITALAGAVAYLALKQTDEQKAAGEFAKSMSDAKNSMQQYNDEVDKNASKELSHIDYVKSLKDELTKLVDENGKVKKGYEGRVQFILNELNNALGTEYKLNGNIIDSYKDLQNNIDKTIEKKRADIKLQAEQEKYKDAIENQEQAVKDLKSAQDNLNMSYEDAKEKQAQLHQKTLEYAKQGPGSFLLYKEAQKNEEAMNNLIGAYDDAETRVQTYTQNVKLYEQDYANYTQGKYNEIGTTIKASTEDWTSKTLQELTTSITEQGTALEGYKTIYANTGNDISLQLSQQAQNNLDSLVTELINRTQTIQTLGPEETAAWKALATSNYEEYSAKLSEMDPAMRDRITNATGIIAMGTPEVVEKAKELGEQTVGEFDRSADSREKALNTMTGYLNGLDDETKKELLKQAGIDDVDEVLKELDRGDLSEENGRNILKGLWKGLSDGSWKGKILGTAAGLAQAVNKSFTGKNGWDEHSPSKKMRKFAEYYVQPISEVMTKRKGKILATTSDLAKSINDKFNNSINTSQIHDMGKFQGNLSNKIVDGTKTIFTTPQITINTKELTEENLKLILQYVNKKFGSKY